MSTELKRIARGKVAVFIDAANLELSADTMIFFSGDSDFDYLIKEVKSQEERLLSYQLNTMSPES